MTNSVYLKPSGRRYYMLIFLAFAALSIALGGLGAFLQFSPWQAIFGLLVLMLAAWGVAFLYFQQQYIHAEDGIITVRRGIITSKMTVIPFNKISEVGTEYGLADRLLGVGKIIIDTAGTDKEEVVFRDIPAQSISTFLALFRQYKGKEEQAQPGPAQKPEEGRDSW